MDAFAEHLRKRAKLTAELATARASGGAVGLRKSTSNLFRDRDRRAVRKLDVRQFNRVLRIDRQRLFADVEGMATYETLVDETLRTGLVPAVTPQLKTITVGGAVSGLGIESSSFRFGLVHETVEEMDVLLGDGRIVFCSRSENQDLFHGFPNSYGTLGYALRLRVGLVPAKRYVRLAHDRFTEPAEFFAHVADLCTRASIDFVDGTIFGRNELYATTGEFRDDAPRVSDYTYMGIYYRSIRRKPEDWLTTRNYLWRWDTDWFWCSKHFCAQNPAVRFLATRRALNSRTYQRVMRLSHRLLPESAATESVIQDVDIPIGKAPEFLAFLFDEIGITPVWVCPFRSYNRRTACDLYPLDPEKLYINFGFWDTVATTRGEGHFNKMVERKAVELGGKKALYSAVYYDAETFWKIYNKARYDDLKARYDPSGVFGDLYQKCVGRR